MLSASVSAWLSERVSAWVGGRESASVVESVSECVWRCADWKPGLFLGNRYSS